jgi:hypothetical protein
VPARIKLKPARRKYGNEPVVIDGQRFDSKREASRWLVLRDLEKAGGISGLERQKRYLCWINGLLVCEYRADFQYLVQGRLTVEDCKGYRTREYLLKRRLMKALYGITILET